MSLLNGFRLTEINISQIPPSLFQGLQRVTETPGILRTNDIENADQVWVIQCPKSANLSSLIEGKKLVLDSGKNPTSLKSPQDDKVYESMCITRESGEGQGISLLLPDESDKIKLVSAPLAGTILIREALEEFEPPRFLEIRKPPHTLPEGIKIRHPIYGVDFSQILSEMENSSDQVDSSSKKKHKRKKDKGREEVAPAPIEIAQESSAIESDNHHKKHSRKRKREEVAELADLEPELLPKKLKRLKKEPEPIAEEPEAEEEDSPTKKHKKKKKKHHEIEDIIIPIVKSEPDQSITNGNESKKHKKKHKKSKHESD